MLRKGMEGAALHDDKWRNPLEAKGKRLAWDMKADWEANIDKTCVVTTRWGDQSVAVVAAHLKPSAATSAYVVALSRTLESFPVVVMGFDANTPGGKQMEFGKFLNKKFLMHTARPAATLTVRKQRTRLQTQLGKVKLDAAMKDWIVVYRHDWSIGLGPAVTTPALTTTGDASILKSGESKMLLPTTLWPFDHAMVSSCLSQGTAPIATSTGWRVPSLSLLGGKTREARRSSESDALSTGRSESSDTSTEVSTSTTRSRRYQTAEGVASSLADMFRGWCRNPGKTAMQLNNLFQITLITLAMGALEIDDRKLLFAFAASMILVVTFGILILNLSENPGIAIGVSSAFFAVALGFMLLLRHFARKIEGLDKFAWKFDEERQKLLDGVAQDERGPPSFSPKEPLRQDSADVEANIARAAELLPTFVTDVLEPLSSVTGNGNGLIKYGAKQKERAMEKTKLDYNGDGARVTDLLRGSVVCNDSIAEVRAAYAKLEELEKQGVLKIIQNKNRCTRRAWLELVAQPSSALELEADGPTCCTQMSTAPPSLATSTPTCASISRATSPKSKSS